MKVLVTGASGFIGRQAIDILARQGRFDVVAVSRGPAVDLPPLVSHESVDLLQPGAAEALIRRVRPTHLLHLAWNATPGLFWNAPDNLDWAASTLTLQRTFLDCQGVRAVMAGTCAEYDWTGNALLSESSAIAPATLYGAIKDATRRAVCAGAERLGGSVAWGRVFWLYGPREAAGRLVSDVVSALRNGQPVNVSEGRQRRDFLHVDDVAGAFVAALDSNANGPFNIGSGAAVPVRDIVQMLGDISGRPELIHFGARPSPVNDPPELAADTRRLHEDIGYVPAISLQDGLTGLFNL